jgi:Holliday junction resolvase RusA-like endonuclease
MLPSDAPPEDGLLQIQVLVAPVSFQATASRKASIVAAVKAAVANCTYLLGGDVKVEIRWGISARARYESDSSADVDNIVKPILDALCGPDGILIDDCQVQELICYWTGGYSSPEQQQVEVGLKFDPDAWLSKAGIVFLQVDRGLYLPMHDDLPGSIVIEQAEFFLDRFASARRMLDHGGLPYNAHLILPIQRVFHRSKIGAFRTTTLDELRERLG